MSQGTYFHIHFPALVFVCCALPLFGLIFCEAWTVLFNYQRLTSTQCALRTAKNYLPSISAAIGGDTPQLYVWQTCIALHTTPRFLIARGYFNMHKVMLSSAFPMVQYKTFVVVTYWLHVTEIVSLLGLSVFPSSQDYEKHAACFTIFLLSSVIHMVLMCWLHGRAVNLDPISKKVQLSLRVKRRLTVLQLGLLGFAIFFFHRHNYYCEDGVYSLFGLTEIFIVVINIAFHATAMWDFSLSNLSLQDLEGRR